MPTPMSGRLSCFHEPPQHAIADAAEFVAAMLIEMVRDEHQDRGVVHESWTNRYRDHFRHDWRRFQSLGNALDVLRDEIATARQQAAGTDP